MCGAHKAHIKGHATSKTIFFTAYKCKYLPHSNPAPHLGLFATIPQLLSSQCHPIKLMLSTLSTISHCLFLLTMSPTFEKACSNTALDVCSHNQNLTQSVILMGAPLCLLHQTASVIELWSFYFFVASFCYVSQLWRIISSSAFTKLALCHLLAFSLFSGPKLVVYHLSFASIPVPSSMCSILCSKDDPASPLLFL